MQRCDVKQAEVIEAPSVSAHPAPRVRLATVRDCRRELAKVYQEARAGKLEPQTATRLAYLLQALVGMIRDHELVERIEKLEKELKR